MSVDTVHKDNLVYLNVKDLNFKNDNSVISGNPSKVLNFCNKAKQADMSLSPTIILPILKSNDCIYKVRTLMDPGSGTNWISKDILKHVEYTSVGSEILEVVTFNNIVKQRFQLVEVYYNNLNQKQSLRCYVIHDFTQHIAVKSILDFIVSKSIVRSTLFNSMVDPATKDVDHGRQSQGIGIILSSSAINKIRSDEKIVLLPELGILLEPTIFGVAVSGKIPESLSNQIEFIQVNCIAPKRSEVEVESDLLMFNDIPTLKQDIDFLWGQESLGVMPNEIHENEKIAMEHFVDSVSYDSASNQYTVSLPWNGKKYLLKDNARVAAGRTRRQQELMISDVEYGTAMCASFNTFVRDDTIEKVDLALPNDNLKYHMPFRGIIKKESETTSCRMVMDASSKPSASDISLNQALYQGPNLTLDLAICLLQFMLGKYGVVSDIEKAFLRILIALPDRDALRFFWFEDPFDRNSKLIVYRFKAVIFGGVCSPFQLAAVVNKLIVDKCKCIYVKDALLQGIYVDNVIHANNSEEQLVNFFEISRDLFLKGNFNLRKWSSNSPKLMVKAKESDVADESKIVKVLGLYWNLDSDRYMFNTNFEWNGVFSKRSVLQFTNRVFDPLGLLTPILIRKRLFMQKLWKKKLKWNESFEFVEGLKDEWLCLVKESHIAVSLCFDRNAFFNSTSEFHIFSDASKEAYGAIIYVRTPPGPECPEGNVHLTFAKGKVAPLDSKLSVPKLEVSGVTLGAHQVPLITKAWKVNEHHKIYLWCDAKAVLHWLAQYNIKDVYVHNRVKDIRRLYNKDNTVLKYVPTAMNPADLITKPQKAKNFIINEEYWSGPKWLRNVDTWPVVEEEYNMYPEGVDNVTNALPVAAINIGLTSILKFFSKYNFETGLRVMAYLLRAFQISRKRMHTPVSKFSRNFVSKEELDQAKITAIKVMQNDMFVEELKSLRAGESVVTGVCRKLNLFFDLNGVIRCRGRLTNLQEPEIRNKPILVHAKHPFVESYIRYTHWHSNCSSRAYTLHRVRQVMYGPHLTVVIKKVVRECNSCRVLRAKPYSYPKMPPLSQLRLVAEKPFAVCGVDYSGPHFVKEGRSRRKVWIALFTCMVSRAVHLEAVPDLTTETFLQALQGLAWKMGTPRVMMSDNATTFVRANKILSDISNTKELQNALAINGISWKFTPTRAPWFGAVYERLIGVLKKEMVKLIGHSLLTYFELTVHLSEIEYIINNRPLVKVGEEEVVTPNNILSGRSAEEDSILTVLNTKEVIDEALRAKKDLPKLNQQTIQRKTLFWKDFQRQYLESIKFSLDTSKSKGSGLLPRKGDMVIMHSHDPRIKWRKAIVLELIASEDGVFRKCKVKTSTGQTIRATNHLYPLEINVEDRIDHIKASKNVETNDFEGFSNEIESPRCNKALKLKNYLENMRN